MARKVLSFTMKNEIIQGRHARLPRSLVSLGLAALYNQRCYSNSVTHTISACIIFLALFSSSAAGLDLRRSTSPWVDDGTNVQLHAARNVCVGAATPLDALSLCTAPVASATRVLLNLSKI